MIRRGPVWREYFLFPEYGNQLSLMVNRSYLSTFSNFWKLVRRDIARRSCRPQAAGIAQVAGIRTPVRSTRYEPFPGAPLDRAVE